MQYHDLFFSCIQYYHDLYPDWSPVIDGLYISSWCVFCDVMSFHFCCESYIFHMSNIFLLMFFVQQQQINGSSQLNAVVYAFCVFFCMLHDLLMFTQQSQQTLCKTFCYKKEPIYEIFFSSNDLKFWEIYLESLIECEAGGGRAAGVSVVYELQPGALRHVRRIIVGSRCHGYCCSELLH